MVDVIYLEFQEAFDKVDHGILFHKIKSLKIYGYVLSWLINFVSHREQCVVIDDFKSDIAIYR